MKRVAITAAAIAAAVAVVWSVVSLTLLAGTDTHGASVEQVSVDSKAVPGEHSVSVVVPDGAGDDSGRPLLLFLHGRSGNSESFTGQEPFFDALDEQGSEAPIVAFPDGGDSSYWHNRDSGDWERYLVDEVIPQVAEKFGADASKVAVGGISMGGFGALDLVFHHPGKFCAAGGHSPAIYLSGGDSAPGAFDDAEDFARNDVLSAARNDPAAFAGTPIWLDAGTNDPFVSGVSEMDTALTSAGADLTAKTDWRGGHKEAYWNAHWRDYMKFTPTNWRAAQPELFAMRRMLSTSSRLEKRPRPSAGQKLIGQLAGPRRIGMFEDPWQRSITAPVSKSRPTEVMLARAIPRPFEPIRPFSLTSASRPLDSWSKRKRNRFWFRVSVGPRPMEKARVDSVPSWVSVQASRIWSEMIFARPFWTLKPTVDWPRSLKPAPPQIREGAAEADGARAARPAIASRAMAAFLNTVFTVSPLFLFPEPMVPAGQTAA